MVGCGASNHGAFQIILAPVPADINHIRVRKIRIGLKPDRMKSSDEFHER